VRAALNEKGVECHVHTEPRPAVVGCPVNLKLQPEIPVGNVVPLTETTTATAGHELAEKWSLWTNPCPTPKSIGKAYTQKPFHSFDAVRMSRIRVEAAKANVTIAKVEVYDLEIRYTVVVQVELVGIIRPNC
jgi:hypothetical protein